MHALFLGAGFSKWAADLPVASQLFDFKVEPYGPREKIKLNRVKAIKKGWDEKNPQGQTEQFISYALNTSKRDKEAVLWYVVRRLSDPFIWQEYHAGKWRRHVLMIDENRKYKRPGVVDTQRFLTKFLGPSLAGIITTNYDILLEYALGTKRFHYGIPNEILIGRGSYPVSQWRNPVTLKGTIPLAKIHGSISWDEYGHYTDGRRALTGKALIVPPVPDKQPHQSLIFQWKMAKKILSKSTRIVFFGFSFNPLDKPVLELLKSTGNSVKSVMIIDTQPNFNALHKLYRNAKVASGKPPPNGNKEITDWCNEW